MRRTRTQAQHRNHGKQVVGHVGHDGLLLAHCWELLPARSPPQLAFGFDQAPTTVDWPEMDQTAGQGGVTARGGMSAVRRRFGG